MTALVLALALAAGPGGEPALPGGPACAPVQAAASPDPGAAADYRAVAEAEEAAGRADTAAAAWRAAAERDPTDPRARASLEALCRGPHPGPFERGLALVRAGNCAEALGPLEEARAGGDHAAALLAGICRYEAGDDAGAGPLLAEAAADPGTRAPARFFLGLLSLRQGRGDEAATLLDAAAADARLAPLAAELSRTARRTGRLVASLALEAGWDSNVDLAPGGSPMPSGASDANAGLAAALTFAPGGEEGFYARASGLLTGQRTHEAYDVTAGSLAAGWQVGHGGRAGVLELGWDHRRLGEVPLVWAARALASARTPLGDRAIASLSWESARDAYLPASRADYSGLRHAFEAGAALDLAGGAVVSAALRAGHDGARDRSLAIWELGPRAALRVPLGRALRVALDAGATWQRADATDPVLGRRREDWQLDATGALEWDLGASLTLRAACAGRVARSNVGEFSYGRIVPGLSLGWVRGIL